jgi:hypothetical protein
VDVALKPIREILASQRTASVQSITLLAQVMIARTTDVKTRAARLDKFLEQEKKNDPEKPTLTPKSMRLNTKVTYSKECDGNPDMVALEEEMAALNRKYSADAGLICKRVAEVQLKVFCKLLLEEFVTHSIDVIENESSFHYSFLFPEIDGDHDKKFLAVKTFVNLIQAPTSEGLDEAFFTDYLETTRDELINIVFEKMAMDEFAKTAIQTQNFPQQALDVAMAVLKDFLQYFTVVTRDLQKYLDSLYKIREAEEKALAYVAKKNLKRAAAETAVDVDGEPTNSATTVTEYICKEAKAAVETAARKIVPKVKQSNNKKHARKNDSGSSKAQKRVKISSIENDTNTKDGNDSKPNGKQKKKKTKPKSILKSRKFQGGSNKDNKGSKKKKSNRN